MKLSPLMLRTWGLALASWGLSQAANDYSASYSWNFTGGNLISNWSFENLSSEVCKSGVNVGVYTDCRFADPSAKSGSFVFRVNSQASGESLASDYLACEPSTLYSISYFVDGNWANRTGTHFPVIQPFKADKSPLVEITGPTYEAQFPQNTNGWKKYSFTFTTAADANWIKIILARSTGSAGSPGNTFKFDNVLVTKEVGEEGVVEARTYGDAAGRVEQTVRNDGSQELVSMPGFDDLGRVVMEYLPATAMRDFPYDLTAICVGTRLPGEMLEYDAATIQEAYNKLKVVVSQKDLAGQPIPVLNIVVSSWGALAPLRNQAATLSFLRDRNQVSTGFQLKGILRYSTEYNDLVSRHGTTASAAGPYGSGTFMYMHSAQYSGVENAWTEYAYPDPGVNTINKVAAPGVEYAMSTNRTRSSGWALVETDAVPSPVEVATASGSGLSMYHYEWSRDPQGKYKLSWKNREGRLVKTAEGVPGNWLATTYDYDSFGRLLGTNTPGGMFYDNEYDGLGQVTASIDPDRGRMEYLYDKRGQLRFSRPGGDVNNMIGTRYDTLGRALGTGKWGQTWAQSAADNYSGLPAGTPDVGFIYDELVPSEFLAQAGVSLTTVGLDVAKLRNGRGRLVASFNRNPEATIPGMTAAERKLVASFYDYDTKGRIQYIYRYIGSIEATADRLQKIKFVYDQNDRLESRLVFKNYGSDEATSVPSSESYFIHDGAGRIIYVLDKDSRVMVQYEYNHLEQMVGVTLYDKIKVGYQYDLRGSLLKIEAITVGPNPEYVFTEELGYHHKPNGHANIPELPEHKKRWDGKISSILKKFSKDVANAVEVAHFEYDVYGRLYTNGKYVSTGTALNGDGSINFGNLAFNGTQTEGFWYGADGQITSRMGQGGMFNYEYRTVNNAPTHQVVNVGPALRRTGEVMSATGGNFLYDSRGRMYRDVGLNKTITYAYASSQPTKIAMGSRNFHMLYDESYNRVTEVEEIGGTAQGWKTYVYETGLDVAKEIVQRTSSHPLGAVDMVKNSLQGKGGRVGFEQESDGRKKLILKDHLGSSVKVFDEATGAASGQEEYGYSSYGILEKKVTVAGDLKPSGTYTGKEYEDALGLYYYGARWWDPELAVWLTPDAYGEYFDPYGTSRNPVSIVDPDGNCELICVAIIVGAAVGAYYGGSKANKSYNPMDWDADMKTLGYMAGGAVIGGAIGAGAAFAGAAAGGAVISGFGLTGTTATIAGGATFGAVSGGLAGFGNALAFGGGNDVGFFNDGDLSDGQYWLNAAKAGAVGAVVGGVIGAGSAWLGGGAPNVAKEATKAANGQVPTGSGPIPVRMPSIPVGGAGNLTIGNGGLLTQSGWNFVASRVLSPVLQQLAVQGAAALDITQANGIRIPYFQGRVLGFDVNTQFVGQWSDYSRSRAPSGNATRGNYCNGIKVGINAKGPPVEISEPNFSGNSCLEPIINAVQGY